MLRLRKILPIHRAIKLEAFLDIEEAFDSTSFDIIIMQRSDIGLKTTFQFVSCMLGDRYSQPHLQENSGEFRGRGLSAVQHFIPSAVEPGCRIPIHTTR